VHREDLVVLVGGEQRVAGLRELRADQQRLDAADEEEDERRDAVHHADLLVVDRGEPAPEAGRRRRPAQQAAGRGALDRHARHVASLLVTFVTPAS
jgi:hypothetical protein